MHGSKFVFSMIVVGFLTGTMSTVWAQDNTPVVVKPIYPANQKSGVKGYFDLSFGPQQTQTLHVQLTNPQSKTVVVALKAADGYTSPQGGIVYDIHADSADSAITDAQYRLSRHIHVLPEVTLAPGQVVDIPITVSGPNLDTGTVIGGVQFITQGPTNVGTQQIEKGKANFVVKTENILSMAIELDLPNTTSSNFSFGDAGFEPQSGQAYIVMNNNAGMIQTGVSGTYKVTGTNGNQVFSGRINPLKMAPKTHIRYPLPWSQSSLVPGTYTLHLSGNIAEKPFNISRTFTIGQNQIQQYQDRHPVTVVQTGTPMWLWGLVAIGVIAIGSLMFMLGRRRGAS